MASRVAVSISLLLSLNLLFFNLVSSTYYPSPPPPLPEGPEPEGYVPDHPSYTTPVLTESDGHAPDDSNYTTPIPSSEQESYAPNEPSYATPPIPSSEPESYAPDESSYTTPIPSSEPEGYAPDDTTYTTPVSSPEPEDSAPHDTSYTMPVPSKPEGYSPTKCERDTLKLGVCVGLYKDLLSVTVGKPPKTPCCSLISDLVDLEAAVCLCTTIKACLLGMDLSVPIDLSLLLNYCGKQVPQGFMCA